MRTTPRLAASAFAVLLISVLSMLALPARAATFTVTTTLDAGPGSLRAAITAANAAAGADLIDFAIPACNPCVITPLTELPGITEQVTIDGYTQSGAQENSLSDPTTSDAELVVELDGSAVASADQGLFVVSSSDVVIRGMVFNDWSEGIRIASGGIGGHHIQGNFIGTNAAGTAADPNDIGIRASSGVFTTIGGPNPKDRNVISGNTTNGIIHEGLNAHTVEGNIIGLSKTGAALGNGGSGVVVANQVTGVRIVDNAISSNGGLGIDLGANGVTPNDRRDRDTGGNNLQNFPVLRTARKATDGATTITGVLRSTPRRVFTIQLFANPTAAGAEGREPLGEVRVRTNRRGVASFAFFETTNLAPGEAITATATSFSTNDTSEFSAPVTVT